jgi:hypothetical protein
MLATMQELAMAIRIHRVSSLVVLPCHNQLKLQRKKGVGSRLGIHVHLALSSIAPNTTSPCIAMITSQGTGAVNSHDADMAMY